MLRFFLLSKRISLLNLNICCAGLCACVYLWVLTWGGPGGAAHGRPAGAAGVGGGSSKGRGSYCPIAKSSAEVARHRLQRHKDGMQMRQNLFVDLLVHERNGYRRFLLAHIKCYVSCITERPIQ